MASSFPGTAVQFRPYDQEAGAAANGLPLRFSGRARFTLDAAAATQRVEAALRRAAHPDRLTAEDVWRYCRAREVAEPRMQLAILREAFRVISREVMIERMASAANRQLTASTAEETALDRWQAWPPSSRGGALSSRFRGNLYREDRSLILRLAVGNSIEPPLTLGPNPTLRARAAHAVTIGGVLAIDGKVEALHDARTPTQIRMSWRVQSGADSVSVAAIAARTSLSGPLPNLLACIGAGALDRFATATPEHLAGLARTDRGPAFVRVERLFRLGRVTEKTRAYELFWQRLRDYLSWRVSDDLAQ